MAFYHWKIKGETMKELIKKIKKRIKQSNIAKLIKFKSTIKDLENKIEVLNKDNE